MNDYGLMTKIDGSFYVVKNDQHGGLGAQKIPGGSPDLGNFEFSIDDAPAAVILNQRPLASFLAANPAGAMKIQLHARMDRASEGAILQGIEELRMCLTPAPFRVAIDLSTLPKLEANFLAERFARELDGGVKIDFYINPLVNDSIPEHINGRRGIRLVAGPSLNLGEDSHRQSLHQLASAGTRVIIPVSLAALITSEDIDESVGEIRRTLAETGCSGVNLIDRGVDDEGDRVRQEATVQAIRALANETASIAQHCIPFAGLISNFVSDCLVGFLPLSNRQLFMNGSGRCWESELHAAIPQSEGFTSVAKCVEALQVRQLDYVTRWQPQSSDAFHFEKFDAAQDLLQSHGASDLVSRAMLAESSLRREILSQFVLSLDANATVSSDDDFAADGSYVPHELRIHDKKVSIHKSAN